MKFPHVKFLSALTAVVMAAAPQQAISQASKAGRTKVVLLGTGTPVPDPDRAGPATAIVVDDSAYLVDFGPGVVRRAKAAVLDKHITALEPANLKVAFVTHLHSDHTAGEKVRRERRGTSARTQPSVQSSHTSQRLSALHSQRDSQRAQRAHARLVFTS
ncbi:MAG TPA: MBL fold metallo-hydrolase [Terriglobales bacterium]|nr:MBL fold metallo-hydrolase [Terriglobales bacterium]